MITDRIIGKHTGDQDGSIAVFIGGIHGNEPAGVLALQRVFAKIYEEEISVKGTIIGLSGNIPALQEKVRYIDKDLNRIWFTRLNDSSEDISDYLEIDERIALEHEFSRIIENYNQPIYFFDLHTTSSQSIPFISISDTVRNRKLVDDLEIPVVLGLEERMEGTLFSFFSELGIPMILYEGGQHEEVSSIDNIESFIWMMMEKVNMISSDEVVDFHRYRERIVKESVFKRRVFELKYRQDIKGVNDFKMIPGYVNFQRVVKGEKVATIGGEDVIIPLRSRIFMPLYQSKGSDGFFLIRGIRSFWLDFSEKIRKFRLDKYLNVLPGIRRHPEFKNSFIVNKYIARYFTLDLFHLLGYRKVIRHDERYIVSRRPYDWDTPDVDTVRRNFRALTNQLNNKKVET